MGDLPFWIGKLILILTGASLQLFPLKKNKGNIAELKTNASVKVLLLFSAYSREFGYRNVQGSKILLSVKPESKIRQEHPGLVDANKDSVLEEVV